MATAFQSACSRLVGAVRSRDPGLPLAFVLASLASAVAMAHSALAGRPAASGTRAPVPALVSSAVQPATEPRAAVNSLARVDETNVEPLVALASRKYRISSNAMRELVHTAYAEARRNRLDPLLIIAVMAIESRFNPLAQSEFGATGLMQVIPRYHSDKFSAANGESVLDPRINIRVGARVLKDYVARGGTEAAGLQLYNGSSWDTRNSYAARVFAERARLREAMRRGQTRVGTPLA